MPPSTATDGAEPAPEPKNAGLNPLSPTVMSGYGVLSSQDDGKSSAMILDEHSVKLKSWFETCTKVDLKQQVSRAFDHELFKLYISMKDGAHKFGDEPYTDLFDFDMWLKKMELSERLPSVKMEKQPTRHYVKVEGVPVLRADVDKPDALPKLFWTQFSKDRLGSAHPPASAASTSPTPTCSSGPVPPSETPPASESGPSQHETPPVKRRLDLDDEGLDGVDYGS